MWRTGHDRPDSPPSTGQPPGEEPPCRAQSRDHHRRADADGHARHVEVARAASIAEFCDYLRTTNNRNGRPYEEATGGETDVFAARALDPWMTAEGIDGDFTVADTAMLNRFLRDYFRQRGQGGTHSQQRNMRHLFSYLAWEEGHPHPYTDALHRYSEQKQRRPATLSADFIKDLIGVTGNGRARDFEGARDHAMIRILTEGIRRGELLGMAMSALPDDLIRNPVIRVVPLKGARAFGQGRLVLLTPSSARAFAAYLRVRRNHRFADSDWVWLGTRNRGQFSTTGIRKMLIRRAAEAGYGQGDPGTSSGTPSATTGSSPAARRVISCASTAGKPGP